MHQGKLDFHLSRLLFVQLQNMGFAAHSRTTFGDLKAALAWPDLYDRWFQESLAALERAGYLNRQGDLVLFADTSVDGPQAWREWEQERGRLADDPQKQAQLNLVHTTLKALPHILSAKVQATDVMFPNSSMKLVEGIYRGNPVSDYFNDVLGSTLAAFLQSGLDIQPNAKFRILEVGAGTGGTTAQILPMLKPFADHIETYRYTDISKAFLMHARREYAPDYPFLETAIFDVEQAVAGQDVEAGSFDIVIATNVLHATQNIRRTLRNVKAVMVKNGALMLNELSGNTLFGHLTFGLLKGWWLYEDPEIRIPGSPVLAPQSWRKVLQEEGFRDIFFPVEDAHDLGQQIIVAESDGLVRQPLPSKRETAVVGAATRSGRPEPEVEIASGGDNDGAGEDRESKRETICRTIIEAIAKTLDLEAERIDRDGSFADYGIDSITGVNLVAGLNESMGIDLETTCIFDHSSVNRLGDYILEEHPPKHLFRQPPQPRAAAPTQVRHVAAAEVAEISRQADVPGKGPRRYDDIAVIGMSGRFAGSENVDALWKHLAAGDDLVGEVTRWQLDEHFEDGKAPCSRGSFLEHIDHFDPFFFNISGMEATYMDPQQRIFMEEAWKALEDAGRAGEDLSGSMTGVYVGCSVGDYQTRLGKNPPPQAFWGNATAVVPARLAYFLNLQGPAVTVDTACSSSLVAIHLACQGLWNKETDMALAGGVFIQSTPNFYKAAGKAGMLSPHGRCHTFDDRADGFVPGEGAGVVVLKRLSEALADGDPIHGIIRGSGLNQDGTTNGITAPSSKSQEKVERYVYETFDINPDSLQMIEAHGTGTILGDPIEFRALNKSFRKDTDRVGFCALGSVKTNLGHTIAAAGVAGVLKLLLSLKHRKIPPSLHFESSNRHIDFDNSPFYVNSSLVPWTRPENGPRRAAISAFGFSGTNAHIVFEEAPERRRVAPQKPAYPVYLSARTADQLRRQAENMLAYLEGDEVGHLGDISYTTLMGRRYCRHRLALVAVDHTDLAAGLRAFIKQQPWDKLRQGEAVETKRAGARTAMIEACLKTCSNTDDRQTYIDALLALAENHVQGYPVPHQQLFADQSFYKIALPTYPFESRRFWAEASTADHIGPSTAALHPLVGHNISTLDVQRYRTTFSGREFFLEDHQVQQKPVLPGVAHLEAALAAVKLAIGEQPGSGTNIQLKNVVWTKPFTYDRNNDQLEISLYPEDDHIRFQIHGPENGDLYSQGSVLLGQALPETPAVDLDGLRQRCNRAQLTAADCYQGLNNMNFQYGPRLQAIQTILVGEDQLLAKLRLPEAVTADHGSYQLHPSLLDAALQTTIGLNAGAADGGSAKTLNPPIPFALEKLLIYGELSNELYVYVCRDRENGAVHLDLCDQDGVVRVAMRGFTPRKIQDTGTIDTQDGQTLFFRPKRQKAVLSAGKASEGPHALLLIGFDEDTASSLKADYNHLTHLPVDDSRDLGVLFIDAAECLLTTAQTMIASGASGSLQVALDQSVLGEHTPFAGLLGFLRTLAIEQGKLFGQLLLLDGENLASRLIAERRSGDRFVHYQQKERMVLDREPFQPQGVEIPWRDHGVYLITGGLGGLGLRFAEEISRQVKAPTLLLCGRSPLDEDKKSKIKHLEELGARVQYHQTDISDRSQVKTLFDSIEEKQGMLHGILHTAGQIKDGYIVGKKAADLRLVLEPKVLGTLHLDELSRHQPLDFFICFSSLAAATGNLGQCDYAGANSFMDHYMAQRAREHAAGKSLSINWPYWAEGGMQVDQATQRMMRQSMGYQPLPSKAGFQAFYQALASDEHNLIVVHGEESRLRNLFQPTSKPRETAPSVQVEQVEAGPSKSGAFDQKALQRRLTAIVADIVQMPVGDLDADAELQSFGFDSLMLTDLANQLNAAFKLDVMPTVFFEHTTLNRLTAYLVENHAGVLAKHFPAEQGRGRQDLVAEPTPPKPSTVPSPTEKTRFRTQSRPQTQGADSGLARHDGIAVIGISGKFPMAEDVAEFWKNLADGRDCISEVPGDRWDWRAIFGDPKVEANKCNIKWGGFMEGAGEFDPLFFGISPKEAELMDPQQRLLMTYAWSALEDAGYAPRDLSGRNIGIFVGTGNSGYERLMAKAKIAIEGNSTTGMVPSVGPNRMSYLLNLHGPSEPIETACSSSLVAIHRAVQAMQLGTCEAAIVGGVNTLVTPEAHISFNKAGMLCEDGRCKTFSARANGYVRGEGVGMLVLKPLTAAEADGDHIYGVIRATAMNHGGRAGSLTAPNPSAQAALLKTAYEQAGIDPRTVGYIEAHGTGTELGDPIEINGLKSAFKALYQNHQITDKPQPHCGIGSVKTNIGHLELSAGVAGVIKVLLQMRHKTLVESLHCGELNPYIQLEDSPFYVVDEKREWPAPVDEKGRVQPRRAGVSSFGIGGVNAHVVLEEYVVDQNRTPLHQDGEPRLVVLSAKSRERLAAYARRLLDFLYEDAAPEQPKPQISTMVAELLDVDPDELEPRTPLADYGFDPQREVKLMERLETEFKVDIDRERLQSLTDIAAIEGYLAELLNLDAVPSTARRFRTDLDLADLCYTLQIGREPMNERLAFTVSDAEQLRCLLERFLEQPDAEQIHGLHLGSALKGKQDFALFTGDEDMAAIVEAWLKKGKLDELGALWVKGFDWDWRGLYEADQLRQGRPKRVTLPSYPFHRDRYWIDVVEDESSLGGAGKLHPLVHENRSRFDQVAFHSTLDPHAFYFDQHIMNGQKMWPGVAYLEAVQQAASHALNRRPAGLKNIVWQKPLVAESQTPEIRILFQPQGRDLHFQVDQGEQIYCRGEVLLEESGAPETTIKPADFIAGAQEIIEGQTFYSRFSGDTRLGPDMRSIRRIHLHGNRGLAEIRLPENVEKQGYVLHPSLLDAAFQLTTRLVLREQVFGIHLPFFLKNFRVYGDLPEHLFVYAYPVEQGGELSRYDVRFLDETGTTLIHCEGFTCREISAGDLLLLTPSYQNAAAETAVPEISSTTIITQTGLELGSNRPCLRLDGETADGDYQKVRRLILDQWGQTRCLFLLIPAEARADLGFLAGLLRSAAMEDRKLTIKIVHLEAGPKRFDLQAQIERELRMTGSEVAWRADGSRQMMAMEDRKLGLPAKPQDVLPAGVYWITGGMGGIGRALAEQLARLQNVTVVLSGRSPLDTDKQQFLDQLAALPGKVCYRQADVLDSQTLQNIAKQITAEHGKLRGIFHAAGLLRDTLLKNQNSEDVKAVLAGKIQGSRNLLHVAQEQGADFLMFFSSLSGIFGNAGQADYAAANAFMDALAEGQVHQGPRLMSINWPLWLDGGMSLDQAQVEAMYRRGGLRPLSTSAAMQAILRVLNSDASRLVVLNGDLGKLRARYLESESVEKETKVEEPPVREPVAADTGNALFAGISEILADTIEQQLKVKRAWISGEKELSDYGFDSITLTDFANKLNHRFALDLAPTDFFEYQSINELSAYLAEKYGHVFAAYLKLKGTGTAAVQTVLPSKVARDPEPEVGAINPRPWLHSEWVEPVARTVAATDIAVIGLAGRLPGAEDLATFRENLWAGRSGISEIPPERWDWHTLFGDPKDGKTHIKWAGFINGIEQFDPLFFKISPREAAGMDPHQRLLMTYIWKAMEDAGIPPEQLKNSRTGIFTAVAGSNEYAALASGSGDPSTSLSAAGTAFVPSRISFALNLKGPSEYVDTACSSTLVALHRAVRAIRAGECEQALIGAVNLLLTPLGFVGFEAMNFLSPRGKAASFQADADGYVRSEGVGALMIKPLEQARADGDPIYAVIKGTGVAHGGKGVSLTAANGRGMREAMHDAYREAGVDPARVGYVETHGIATPLADQVEIQALKEGYAAISEATDALPCYLSSLKPLLGHGEIVSGFTALVKVIEALRHKQVPALPGFEKAHESISLENSRFHFSGDHQPWPGDASQPALAAINSYGFTGVNAHVVLEAFSEAKAPVSPDGPVLIVLSGRKAERLPATASRLADFLERSAGKDLSIRDIAYTLQVGRQVMAHRLAFSVADRDELITALRSFADGRRDGFRYSVEPRETSPFGLLADDEDSAAMVAGWVRKGKLDKVAALWVAGYDLDWSMLYNDGQQPRRVHLPGYALEEQHFPLPKLRKIGDAAKPVQKPGLEQATQNLVNISDLRGPRYAVSLSNYQTLLNDHQVAGQAQVPGVLLLEWVRAAFGAATGYRDDEGAITIIQEHRWHDYCRPQEGETLHLLLEKQDNGSRYRIQNTAEPALVFADGIVLRQAESRPTDLDIADLLERINQHQFTAELFYREFAALGVQLGSGLRCLDQIQAGQNAVLARYQTTDDSDRYGNFVLSPVVLDAALQACFGLSIEFYGEVDKAFAALGIDQVAIFAPTPKSGWVHARAAGEKDGRRKTNLSICDEDGRIAVEIRGFTTRYTPKGGEIETGKGELPSMVAAIEARLPAIQASIQAQVDAFHDAYSAQIHHLQWRLVVRNLEKVGLLAEPEAVTRELAAKVGPSFYYGGWIKKTLHDLVDQGLIEADGRGYRIVDPELPDLAGLWRMWDHQKPVWFQDVNKRTYLVLVEGMLKSMPEILRGERLPTDIMFPNSSMELVADMYKGNTIADIFNDALHDTLIAYVSERVGRDPNARIRILEIGAGTGGTTEGLLARLKPYQDNIGEYCFTDLSKAFLIRAQRRYHKAYPYLTTAIFDIGQPFETQPIDAGAYDLVIAANVLHATDDIRKTLRCTRAAMARHGLLFLNELSMTFLDAHLTFGMLEGWWKHKDPELRIPGCPALSPEGWRRVLQEEGFGAVLYPGQPAHHFGQQIVVAEMIHDGDDSIPSTNGPKPSATGVEKPTSPATAVSPSITVSPSEAPQTLSLEALIRAEIATALDMPLEEIGLQTGFGDLGLDSITGVQMVESLNKRLGIEVKTTALFEHQNIVELSTYIRGTFDLDDQGENPGTTLQPGPGEAPSIANLVVLICRETAAALDLPVEEVSPQVAFTDIGLDSITGVQLVEGLNQLLGIDLKTTALFETSDAEALAAYIHEKFPALEVKSDEPSAPAENPVVEIKALPEAAPAPESVAKADDFQSLINLAREQTALALDITIKDVGTDTPFADIGLDSITGVQLVEALNRILDLDLKTTVLFDHRNLNELVTYILEQSNQVEVLEEKNQENASQTLDGGELVTLIREQIAIALDLKVEEVGEHTHFADIGLDSITGVQLVEALNQILKLDIKTTSLFEHGTAAELARHIQNMQPEPPPRPGAKAGETSAEENVDAVPQPLDHPLSQGQQGLWALQQMYPEMSAYNCPFGFQIPRTIDAEAFKRGLALVARKFPILLSRVALVDGQPVQQYGALSEIPLEEQDIDHLDPERLQRVYKDIARRPFDLENGPLVRFYLLKSGDSETLVVINIHHIIFDGISSAILFQAVWQAYLSQSEGRAFDPTPNPVDYGRFVAWEAEMLASEQGAAHRRFWLDTLDIDLPRLQLVGDQVPEAQTTFSGDTFEFRIDAGQSEAIKEWNRRHTCNLSVFFLGIYKLLLSRYGAGDQLLIGMPVKGRPEKRFETVLGYFVNMVVVGSRLPNDQSFAQYLKTLQTHFFDALSHAAYPLPRLIQDLQQEGRLNHGDLFNVVYNYQQIDGEAGSAALGHSRVIDELRQAGDHELGLEVYQTQNGFRFSFNYRDNLFSRDWISRMSRHFLNLITSVLEREAAPPHKLDMLDPEEHTRLLHQMNPSENKRVSALPVHALFEKQVAVDSSAPALQNAESEAHAYSYGQLNRMANQIAAHLKNQGAGPGDVVGVAVKSAHGNIIALLGVLKAGCVYLPLNPLLSADQLRFMQSDTKTEHIIVDRGTAGQIAKALGFSPNYTHLDNDAQTIRGADDHNPEIAVDSRRPAYILYTSGSTGKPKGVLVHHAALSRHIQVIADHYQIDAKDNVLGFAPAYVDVSLEQSLPVLIRGGRLIAKDDQLWSPQDFHRMVRLWNITVCDLPPAYLHEILLHDNGQSEDNSAEHLRLIIVGGEALKPETAKRYLKSAFKHIPLLNAYGPTETTITSTTHTIRGEADLPMGEVPIGRPLSSEFVYLLDEHGHPVPEGVPGRLYIGGSGVSLGYLERPELTASRFIANPYLDGDGFGSRLYDTGDLARFLPGTDGLLAFMGRVDQQVKIRGYRVELGEIENALGRFPAAGQPVVKLVTDARGHQRLVAYLVPDLEDFDTEILKEFAADELPDYMRPELYLVLDRFPTNAAGKIDRSRLPEVDFQQEDHEYQPPKAGLESELAELWQEVLQVDRVGRKDHFFELGGHSLLAVRLTAMAKARFATTLRAADLLKYPCLKDLAHYLKSGAGKPEIQNHLVLLREGKDRPPLFLFHPASGTCDGYLNLINLLDRNRPVYGLIAPGLYGERMPETLTDLARLYAASIVKAQPSGPIHLAGWSLGGLLAYEVAQQLEAAGEQVGLLALIDSYTPEAATALEDAFLQKERRLGTDDEHLSLKRFAWNLFAGDEETLNQLSLEDRKGLKKRLNRIAIDRGLWDKQEGLYHQFTVFRTVTEAMDHYRPGPYLGRQLLLLAAHTEGEVAALDGWNRLAGDALTVFPVQGDHLNLLKPPHVGALASALQAALNVEDDF